MQIIKSTSIVSTSSIMERPPPHSITAISAKRVGGTKIPKPYRKYHKSHMQDKSERGSVAAKATNFLIRTTRAAFEALR